MSAGNKIGFHGAKSFRVFSSDGRLCLLSFGSVAVAFFLAGLLTQAPLDAAEAPSAPVLPTQMTTAQLIGVHFSSALSKSRVVIELSGDARYKVGRLSNPERLYLDLQQTGISPQFTNRRIALRDAVVDQIRIGMNQGPVTRVVLDLHSPVRYAVSLMDDPARILVELARPLEGKGLAESAQTQSEGPVSSSQYSPGPGSNFYSNSPSGANEIENTPTRPETELPPQTYGTGEKAGLEYAGTASPRNLLLLGLDFGTLYNDNIFGNNQQRIGDAEFEIGPSISLRRQVTRFGVALSYQPHFLIYRKASELNTLSQTLGLDTSYRATYRLTFRARASANYWNGIFQPSQNQEFLPGLGSPSSVNQTLYTPTLRQFSLSSRLDAGYQLSPHNTVSLYGGQSLFSYEQQIPNVGNLGNSHETDAGLLFQHQLSPHASLGFNYLFQDILFGPFSQTLVNSIFLTYAQQFSPSVTISAFGGPQYSNLNETLSFAFGSLLLQAPISGANWNWALGGAVTKRLDKTVFLLSAAHQVTNGGGFTGAVASTSVEASVRRRLPGHWDATWSVNYANNNFLSTGGPSSAYQSVTAGYGMQRPITDKLSLRIGYDYLHQKATGQSSPFANLDENLVSIRFSYRFHEISLNQ